MILEKICNLFGWYDYTEVSLHTILAIFLIIQFVLFFLCGYATQKFGKEIPFVFCFFTFVAFIVLAILSV